MSKDKNIQQDEFPVDLLKTIELFANDHNQKKDENDSAIASVVWYEKIRAAVEYQETHLMFKNSISRTIYRNIVLSSKIKPEKLLGNLINELVWANYITPKTIDEKKSLLIISVLTKYMDIISRANSINMPHTELVRYFSSLCACEIEEVIFNKRSEIQFLDFVYNGVKENFVAQAKHISNDDHVIQLKLALYYNIIKPDMTYLSYYALKLTYKNWHNYSLEEVNDITKSIDPFVSSYEKHLYNPLRNRYMLAVRNMISPYSVIRAYLLSNYTDISWAKQNPTMLIHNFMQAYESLRVQSNIKIWRGIWRALIFLFTTKTVLAFLIEIPVDKAINGEILWLPLLANVLFPPMLMFLSGITISKIPDKNSALMQEALSEIVNTGKLSVETPFVIEKKIKTKSSNIFNYILNIFSIILIVLVIQLLLILHFSVISIILFFVFVSAVSFLSFRIRVNSKELLVKRKNQDSITTLVEFIFLPFISIGKKMSDGLNKLNPILLAVDFLIEAPFKTIVKILRAWFNFISAKKEEMEY